MRTRGEDGRVHAQERGLRGAALPHLDLRPQVSISVVFCRGSLSKLVQSDNASR